MTQQFATAVMGSSSLSLPQREQLDGVGIESRDELDSPQIIHTAFGWWRTGSSTAGWDDAISFYCWEGDPYDFGTTGACRLANGLTATNVEAGAGSALITNRFVGDVRYWDEGFYMPPGVLLPGNIMLVKIRGNVRNNAGADRTVHIVLDPDSNVRLHGITGLSLGDWSADATDDELDWPDVGNTPSPIYTGQRIEVWDADTTGLSTSTLYYAKAVKDVDGVRIGVELYTAPDLSGTQVNLAAGTATIATASNLFGNAANTGDVITLTAHGLAVGDVVQVYDKGNDIPPELTEHTNYTVSAAASADTFEVGTTLTTTAGPYGVRRRPAGSKNAAVFSFVIPGSTYTARTGYELDITAAADVGNSSSAASTDAVVWTAKLMIGPATAGAGTQLVQSVDKSTAGVGRYDWGIRETLQYGASPSGSISAGMLMVGSTSGAYGIVIEQDVLGRRVHYRPITKDKRFEYGETVTCYTVVGPTVLINDATYTYSTVDFTNSQVRVAAHGLSDDTEVRLFAQPRTSLPTPLASTGTYYVDAVDANLLTFHTANPVSSGNIVPLTASGAAIVVLEAGKVTFTARTRQNATGIVMGFRFMPGEANAAATAGLEFNIHDVSVVVDRIRARGS